MFIGLYIAWGIGTNDETMATVAGSRFLGVNSSVILGGLFALVGAILLGGGVEETIGKGLVNFEISIKLSLIVLFAVATWLTLASYKGWPISTTHSIVGAVIGLGLFMRGWEGINFATVYKVIFAWFFSPLVGFVGAYVTHMAIGKIFLARMDGLRSRTVSEYYFAHLLAVAALLNEFSRGGNDIANASALLSVSMGTVIDPALIRVVCGVTMFLGLVVLGRRVVKFVGNNIVELTPSSSFSAQIATTIIVLICTLLKLPVSSTHVLVASIAGVGLARGVYIDVKSIAKVVFAWVATFPASALFTVVVLWLLMPVL